MWIYEMIILPGTDWLTFGFFGKILRDCITIAEHVMLTLAQADIFADESRRLFICGMLVANGW